MAGVNKTPFAGRSGAKQLTSRVIRERLAKELEVNVALRVEDTGDGDTVQVLPPAGWCTQLSSSLRDALLPSHLTRVCPYLDLR